MTVSVSLFVALPLVHRDSMARMPEGLATIYRDGAQFIGCRLTRAETSEQQLVEVLTDFWENHFSVTSGKVSGRAALLEYDRGVIRPRALGRFRDLLGAVAHSPAMLTYLDNAVSSVDSTHTRLRAPEPVSQVVVRPGFLPISGLNENYARELLELHTLGVDGGYTQLDVIAVARALSGWTHSWAPMPYGILPTTAIRRTLPLAFVFDPSRHDADEKVVLGRILPAGRGIEDGEEVLDILARHPSTARFIARKLAVRLVSDEPPAALIDRAAQTFLATDGDIREVVRTIVKSPEFFSAEAYRAKIKSPLEFVVSLRRAMGAPIDTAAQEIDLLLELRQPPFGKLSPNGWPETGSAWMTADAIRARLNIAEKIARGEMGSIPVTSWPGWSALVAEPFDQQLDGVIAMLLDGRVSTRTRWALSAARSKADGPEDRAGQLRDLIALALSSPEFQRR